MASSTTMTATLKMTNLMAYSSFQVHYDACAYVTLRRSVLTGSAGSLKNMSDTLVARDVVQRVLNESMGRGADFAEVFVEDRANASASLDQRRIQELSSARSRGAGVRVVVGETTGFAHTADLSEAGLLSAARAAAAVAREGRGGVREVHLEDLRDFPSRARGGALQRRQSGEDRTDDARRRSRARQC